MSQKGKVTTNTTPIDDPLITSEILMPRLTLSPTQQIDSVESRRMLYDSGIRRISKNQPMRLVLSCLSFYGCRSE